MSINAEETIVKFYEFLKEHQELGLYDYNRLKTLLRIFNYLLPSRKISFLQELVNEPLQQDAYRAFLSPKSLIYFDFQSYHQSLVKAHPASNSIDQPGPSKLIKCRVINSLSNLLLIAPADEN